MPSGLKWIDRGIPLSPVARLRLAWLTLVLSILGMLISLVFVHNEPPTVLALSWGAITITAIDILCTSDVRATQEIVKEEVEPDAQR